VVWERVGIVFPHILHKIALKQSCDLTDVPMTRSFALLVKSLQTKRTILCGNARTRMLILFELFDADFVFIWCGNAVPIPFFSALHPCGRVNAEWSGFPGSMAQRVRDSVVAPLRRSSTGWMPSRKIARWCIGRTQS